jgi:hypothetical protein
MEKGELYSVGQFWESGMKKRNTLSCLPKEVRGE